MNRANVASVRFDARANDEACGHMLFFLCVFITRYNKSQIHGNDKGNKADNKQNNHGCSFINAQQAIMRGVVCKIANFYGVYHAYCSR